MVKISRREQATTLTFPCLDPGCQDRFANLASRSKHVCRKHPDLKKPHGGHNKKPPGERAPKKKKKTVPNEGTSFSVVRKWPTYWPKASCEGDLLFSKSGIVHRRHVTEAQYNTVAHIFSAVRLEKEMSVLIDASGLSPRDSDAEGTPETVQDPTYPKLAKDIAFLNTELADAIEAFNEGYEFVENH